MPRESTAKNKQKFQLAKARKSFQTVQQEKREEELIRQNLELRSHLNKATLEVEKLAKLLEKQKETAESSNSVLLRQCEVNSTEMAGQNLFLLQVRTELKETERKRSNLQNLIKKLDTQHVSASGPPPTKARCQYNVKSSKIVKDSYCQLAFEYLEKLVGLENMDDFASHLVHNIAKSDNFSFRFQLNERITSYCKIRFNWSDSFMKEFKSICKERLGFDILSSRGKTGELLRQAEPELHYEIKMVETPKKNSLNDVIQELSTVVTIRDLKRTLEGRLSMLSQSQRLHPGDIVIGVGGDKGGETTKVCLIIQNVDTPNNPQGILLLGMYYGPDNHEYLEKYMLSVFEQLNNLSHVEFEVPGGAIEKRLVKMKPIGDCLFLSALMHHKGPTCSHPCFICEFKYSSHGSEKARVGTSNFESSHTKRTLASISISGRPLLNVNPEDFGIPPVHTIHGITQKYGIDPLIAKANALDSSDGNIPVNLAEQKTYFKNLKVREEICLAQTEDFNHAISALDELKAGYEKLLNKNKRMTRRKFQKCSSSICAAQFCKNPKLFSKKEFVQCNECDGFFHSFCTNIVTSEEKLQLQNGLVNLKCFQCKLGREPTPTDHILEIDSLRATLSDRYREDEIEFCALNHERQELESLLKHSSGFYRRKLETVLRGMGCDHRIWYQEMTGNQIRKLLRADNIKKLIDVFPDSDDIRLIGEVLTELAFLMTNSDNAEKSDSKIYDIEKSIERLVLALKKVHKDTGVILKLHLLAAHLIPHLRVHRSWGRVSEQGIESLHALINKLNRTFAPVRNITMRTSLILQYLINQNKLFDVGQSWKKEK